MILIDHAAMVNVLLLLLIFDLPSTRSFSPATIVHLRRTTHPRRKNQGALNGIFDRRKASPIQLDIELDDQKVESLYAWICKAFEDDDDRYNNLVLAVVAVFGTGMAESSEPMQLLRKAEQELATAEPFAAAKPYSQLEREQASLGAMGANQWMGYFATRPHALLQIHNYTAVEDWKRSLPRGCQRTLKRASSLWTPSNNTTKVVDVPIVGGQPAPHATKDHFRCVLYHELRVIMGRYGGADNDNPNIFLNALAEAVSRYMGTTRMTGQVSEYWMNNTLLGFAHTVRKGRTLRGQWFYAADATQYIWFDSVARLVEAGIGDKGIETLDLGPSGSDSFSDLKAKYGFLSVRDWTAVADYRGAFWDYATNQPSTCPRLDERYY